MIQEGDTPPVALEKTAGTFNISEATLSCLRRDPITERSLEFKTLYMEEDPCSYLYQKTPTSKGLSVIDYEYMINYELVKKTTAISTIEG